MPADITSSTPIHSLPKKSATGDVSVAAAVPEESSDDNAAGGGYRKSVWKSVNGVVEPAPVMGGDAWPTITESTRGGSSKLVSSSSKNLSDGSVSVVQEQVTLHASPKQATANGHHNSNHNRKQPHRQRSMKKGGSAGSGSGQSDTIRPPPPPPPPPFPIPFGNVLHPRTEMPIRDPASFKGNNRDARPLAGGGSHSPRHPSRRGNFGSRPAGDGGYNHSYGARHDHDRERNASRNSSGREVHMHHMVPPPPPPPPPPRGLARPVLPGPIPYIPPPLVRPFGGPMPFDMVPPYIYGPPMSPDSFRTVPLILPPHPHIYLPLIDPHLRTLLLNQIDYYFSEDNLVKDDFLRSNMDDQGWVSISLIASFPRVLKLTSDVQLILDTLGASTVVEVQGDKIRRRDNWNKWIPSFRHSLPDLGLQSQSESTDIMLATSIQEVHLDKETTNGINSTDAKVEHSETEPSRVPSSDYTITQLEPGKGENLAEASIQGCA
ncbi:hypothetical protein DCAR_0832280 [Daucus carota subsp. sativus]|uniref:HTH La-type RNA-binding domain-containing protein n=1 Tax=Daucus carota subsp. sativus TaxID=79200 RepID=A0AAF1BDA0_DAUCS|nr:PREDICTED: la-related protein 1B-like [Daucus carota subsp. sativus]WOH12772.1 hypothetical protein DCAR_0832280 [Daucus carota subsp. sativus]